MLRSFLRRPRQPLVWKSPRAAGFRSLWMLLLGGPFGVLALIAGITELLHPRDAQERSHAPGLIAFGLVMALPVLVQLIRPVQRGFTVPDTWPDIVSFEQRQAFRVRAPGTEHPLPKVAQFAVVAPVTVLSLGFIFAPKDEKSDLIIWVIVAGVVAGVGIVGWRPRLDVVLTQIGLSVITPRQRITVRWDDVRGIVTTPLQGRESTTFLALDVPEVQVHREGEGFGSTKSLERSARMIGGTVSIHLNRFHEGSVLVEQLIRWCADREHRDLVGTLNGLAQARSDLDTYLASTDQKARTRTPKQL